MKDDVIDFDRWGRRVPPFRPRLVGILVGGIALLAVLFGTFYQVQPEAVGVVMRFGKFVRTSEPGLHVKVPFVETVHRVPVQRQLKHEFGFRTVDAGVQTQYSEADFSSESVMLTGDLNVAVVEWIVQYRVADPYKFLFKVRNLDNT